MTDPPGLMHTEPHTPSQRDPMADPVPLCDSAVTRVVVLVCIAQGLAACSPENPDVPPAAVRQAADAIDSARLSSDVHWLASDALAGRATPSSGLDSAMEFVARRVMEAGLTPAGDRRLYFQQYVVRTARRDTAASWLEVNGRRFREGDDYLVAGFTDSGTFDGPVTYVAHGIHAPRRGLDPYATLDVANRLVLAHGPFALPKGETLESMGHTVGVEWAPPDLVARERGAAGVILINSPADIARWPRLIDRGFGREWTDLWPDVPGWWSVAGPPTIWVKPHVASAILADAAPGVQRILAGAATADYVAPFELPKTTRAAFHLGLSAATDALHRNLVAVVEGRDRTLRNEYVVLMAHLDGHVLPIGTDGDSIYNAADDNASGTVGLLAVAEALMRGPRPRRSILLLWDTGEEVGLWGSRFFAANPPVPLSQIVAVFNVDMIGRSRSTGGDADSTQELARSDEIYVVGPRVLSASLDSALQRSSRVVGGLSLNHAFDRADHEYFFPRTDAAPFLERGVLTVDVFNGEHGDYHDVGDEASKLDIARIRRVAQLLYGAAWLLAERRDRPAADKAWPPSVARVTR